MEAVPNLTEDYGRVFTEHITLVYRQFGTYPAKNTFETYQ